LIRLTERQTQVLSAIVAHFEQHACTPTVRELADAVGIGSTNAMTDHVDALEAKGFIRRLARGKSRGIVVCCLADGTRVEPRLVPIGRFPIYPGGGRAS
jgi:SOS-response transcriptional repressor LexA